MVIMTAGSILYDKVFIISNSNKAAERIDHKPFIKIAIFLIVAVVIVSSTFLVSNDAEVWNFAYRGIISSLTSFGGGEVYYSIAYDTFVLTGFISEDFYLTKILGIAGAMPGPVIVSILSGVGFAYGYETGGVGIAWLFGIVGASMAITATALGASTLYAVFNSLKNSPRLKVILKHIMPLICGVLLSVAVQLTFRATQVISIVGIHPLISLGVVIGMFMLMVLIDLKFQINSIFLFLIGGVTTLIGLGALNLIL
jgi:chromate transporter